MADHTPSSSPSSMRFDFRRAVAEALEKVSVAAGFGFVFSAAARSLGDTLNIDDEAVIFLGQSLRDLSGLSGGVLGAAVGYALPSILKKKGAAETARVPSQDPS